MLRAGHATIDITPTSEADLIGYDFRQEKLPSGNAGVLDTLEARVLVLEDGATRALIASVDVCVLEVDLARRLRAVMADAAACPVNHVIIATTHTHSGPYAALTGKADDGVSERAAAYGKWLEGRLAEAAAQAGGLTHAVTARAIEAPLGIGYKRRVQVAGKVRMCWNPLEAPELQPEPSPDPTCSMLVLAERTGPRRHVVFSLGAHPVCLGKTSRRISADWPGEAMRYLRQSDAHVHPSFVLGACGEVHAWVATQEDAAEMRAVGRAAGAFVDLLARSGAGRFDDRAGLSVATRTWTCGQLELDLAAVRVGPALLLAAPVELFASLSAELRKRVPGPLLLATVANGWTGYWPDRQAFAEGEYEVRGTWGITPGDGEALVDELAALADSLPARGD